MIDIYDPAPFLAHPEFPGMVLESSFRIAMRDMVAWASKGPCQKSRRGVLMVGDGYMAIDRNAPAGGRTCDGSPACAASCASTCNHAEERAVIAAMRRGYTLARAHMIHVAVTADGTPRDKAVPGCVTCSRLMLEAGVEHVWLWGGIPARWQSWTADAFHTATLANLALHDPLAPAHDLRPFVRVTEVHAPKPRFRASFKGETVICADTADAARMKALGMLQRAGVATNMSATQAMAPPAEVAPS
jgi:deoxycytidylate deaminase